MITVDLILFFYQYFYNKKYSIATKFHKVKHSSISIKHSETFIKLLYEKYGNTIEHEFLYRYFIFQFNYWDKLGLEGKNTYNKQIQLSFIIGKKAFDRFLNRDPQYDWTIEILPFVKKYQVKKGDLIEQLHHKHKIVVKKGVDTEAAIKLASYNKPAGLVNCMDFSTMYNHKSHICRGCIYKDDCKKLLKQMYPSIYIDRGY